LHAKSKLYSILPLLRFPGCFFLFFFILLLLLNLAFYNWQPAAWTRCIACFEFFGFTFFLDIITCCLSLYLPRSIPPASACSISLRKTLFGTFPSFFFLSLVLFFKSPSPMLVLLVFVSFGNRLLFFLMQFHRSAFSYISLFPYISLHRYAVPSYIVCFILSQYLFSTLRVYCKYICKGFCATPSIPPPTPFTALSRYQRSKTIKRKKKLQSSSDWDGHLSTSFTSCIQTGFYIPKKISQEIYKKNMYSKRFIPDFFSKPPHLDAHYPFIPLYTILTSSFCLVNAFKHTSNVLPPYPSPIFYEPIYGCNDCILHVISFI